MDQSLAADSFQAMGSDARLAVLRTLIRAGQPGLAVGEIQARTGIAASTLSHHIRVLVDAGVIRQRREGRTIVNTAAFDHLEALAGFILTECCADAARDATHEHHKEDALT